MSTQPKRYAAFISYSHHDHVAARWLHRTIENYRLPRDIRRQAAAPGALTHRLSPIFIDREELSSSADLAASVRLALSDSEWLIVVLSPSAAKSRWVNEEVRTFKELGRADRILCLVVGGDPRLGASAETDCFPPSLRFEVKAGLVTDIHAAEPLAADIRAGSGAKRDSALRIIAGLLQLPLDELRRREQVRRQRRLALLAGASAIGCVVLAGLALLAWQARNDAERQRKIATEKSLTAERTAGFIVSLFEVSDPSEARGNSVTAREILDRGAVQIRTSLRDEPRVRSELASVLGRVYYGLGLYGPAADLLLEARSVPGLEPSAIAKQNIILADIDWARGDYAKAGALYLEADRQISLAGAIDPALHARALVGLGDTASMQERYAEANTLFEKALGIAKTNVADSDLNARVFESLGRSNLDSGHLDQATTGTSGRSTRAHAPRESPTRKCLIFSMTLEQSLI